MPETVTIQLSDGQPFTATTQDRWIILPTGRLPHSSTVGELEWMMNAKINDDALVIPSEPMKKMGWRKTDLANAELNAQIDGGSPLWFAIRPTEGRSWSDIGLAEQPAQAPVWTVVYAPVPLDQVEEVQYKFSDGWSRSPVTDGSTWGTLSLAYGCYRVRYKPGYPKPETATKPDYTDWVEVTASTAPADLCVAKYECEYNAIANNRSVGGWKFDQEFASDHFGHKDFHWRIRLRRKPEVAAQPDPRISALEAENAALRWALATMRVHFVSARSCFLMQSGGVESIQAEAADIPHFLAARAAMERKP